MTMKPSAHSLNARAWMAVWSINSIRFRSQPGTIALTALGLIGLLVAKTRARTRAVARN